MDDVPRAELTYAPNGGSLDLEPHRVPAGFRTFRHEAVIGTSFSRPTPGIWMLVALIAEVVAQEARLQFTEFTHERAWMLGARLREHALERSQAITIDIALGEQRRFPARDSRRRRCRHDRRLRASARGRPRAHRRGAERAPRGLTCARF